MAAGSRSDEMLFSGVDAQKLIAAVRRRPALWDPAQEHYANKACRVRLWRLVGQEVVPGFADFTDTKKNSWVHLLISRWKNIRDTFRKVLINKSRNVGSYKKYVYQEEMNFMNPILSVKRKPPSIFEKDLAIKLKTVKTKERKSGTVSASPYVEVVATARNDGKESEKGSFFREVVDDDDHTATADASKKRLTPAIEKASCNSLKDNGEDSHDEAFPKAKESWKGSRKKQENLDEQIMEMLVRSEQLERTWRSDEDMMFFQSLVPSVRRLPETARLGLRADILRLLQKYVSEYGSAVEEETSWGASQEQGIVAEDETGTRSPEPLLSEELTIEYEGVQYNNGRPPSDTAMEEEPGDPLATVKQEPGL